MTMSNRIAVMNRGHYEQLADPETLYEHPATRFVAGFLGVSNLLGGTREGVDGDHAIIRMADGTRLRVPASLLNGASEVEVGVRPEKIRLASADETIPASHNRLAGTVRDASYVGVSTQYVVEARSGARITVYEQNVERASRAEFWAPGEEVNLHWLPEHSFVISGHGGSSEQ